MTRAELFTRLAREHPYLERTQIELAVRYIFEGITDALARGERVELRGFGTFSPRKSRARVARNPRNGERLDVPEKSRPFFRASKTLVERINGAAPLEDSNT